MPKRTCECGKQYVDSSGLSKHRKKCMLYSMTHRYQPLIEAYEKAQQQIRDMDRLHSDLRRKAQELQLEKDDLMEELTTTTESLNDDIRELRRENKEIRQENKALAARLLLELEEERRYGGEIN